MGLRVWRDDAEVQCRGVKRRLAAILAFISMTTCAALIVLWIRSAYAGDVVYVRMESATYRLRSDSGRVSLTASTVEGGTPSVEWARTSRGWAGDWPGPAKRVHNLGIVHARAGMRVRTTLPFWAIETYHPVIIALFALPLLPRAIAPWRRLKAARRLRAGCCPRCGYDVRASAERCPECGEPVAAAFAAASLGERKKRGSAL